VFDKDWNWEVKLLWLNKSKDGVKTERWSLKEVLKVFTKRGVWVAQVDLVWFTSNKLSRSFCKFRVVVEFVNQLK
jgi:hypothetical protein